MAPPFGDFGGGVLATAAALNQRMLAYGVTVSLDVKGRVQLGSKKLAPLLLAK